MARLVAVDGRVSSDVAKLLSLKFFKNEAGIYTFQSSDNEEKVREVFSRYGEIKLFECFGMSLNEIFVYETEGKANEIEGIFAK